MIRPAITLSLLVLMAITLSSCGGPPDEESTFSMYADLDATRQWARDSDFKMCNVQGDAICQSPDSVLVFHMPRRLHDAFLGEIVQNEMTIENNGIQDITITDFYMTAVDDSNYTYEALLEVPSVYRSEDVGPKGLTLSSQDRVDIGFQIDLSSSRRTVQQLIFFYTTPMAPDMSRIIVSYRRSSIRNDENRDLYRDHP